MTLALRAPARARPSVGVLRARWWMHPEAPWLALSIAAWTGMAVAHVAGHAQAADQRWSFSPFWWTTMVVAMMVPGALPMQRLVVFDSLWRRRHRSGAWWLAGYVGVWVAFGLGLAAFVAVVEQGSGASFDPGRRTTTAVLAAAVIWQVSPAKARALKRCHRRRAFAPRGWRNTRDLIRYGGAHANACVGSCGVVMAAMFVSAHDFHLMVPLAVVTVVERFQRYPKPAAGAAAIAAVAALNLLPIS